MKKLEELGISPAPWNADMSIEDDAWVEDARGNDILRLAKYERKNARFIAAAPEMYEQLRQSTNMIEHTIQFVKNADIKNALRKLADENKSALAKAAGEEVEDATH